MAELADRITVDLEQCGKRLRIRRMAVVDHDAPERLP